MRKFLCLLCFVTISTGCRHKNQEKNYADIIDDVTVITLDKENNSLFSEFVDSVSFVTLEEHEGFYYSNIGKMQLHSRYIYILDNIAGTNSLLRFDQSGRFDRKIGNRGNGPNEYVNLRDFHVSDSTICLFDQTRARMLIYDHDCNFKSARDLPFFADAMIPMDSGQYLFSLMQSDSRDKLVVTDSLFDVKTVLLSYDEDFKDDKFTDHILRRSNDVITFNKPINDSVYIINTSGSADKAYYLDFGSHKVPEELRNSYELFVENRNDREYQYFYDTPIIVEDLMVCPIFNGPQKASLLVDITNNSFKMTDLEPNAFDFYDTILFPIYANSNCIVGVIDFAVYNFLRGKPNLSPLIVEKMRKGERVLCFYYLKKRNVS